MATPPSVLFPFLWGRVSCNPLTGSSSLDSWWWPWLLDLPGLQALTAWPVYTVLLDPMAVRDGETHHQLSHIPMPRSQKPWQVKILCEKSRSFVSLGNMQQKEHSSQTESRKSDFLFLRKNKTKQQKHSS